jgi:hypothetical protein
LALVFLGRRSTPTLSIMRLLLVFCGLLASVLAAAQTPPREPPPNEGTASGMLMSFAHSADVVGVVCVQYVPQIRLQKVLTDWRERNRELIQRVDVTAGTLHWVSNAPSSRDAWEQHKAQNARLARFEIERMMKSAPKEWCEQVTQRFQAKEFDLARFPEQLKLLGIR